MTTPCSAMARRLRCATEAPGLQAVGSPAEALELLMSDGEGFDLVLLDYRLPGTDGLRCAAEAVERHQPGRGADVGRGRPHAGPPRGTWARGLPAQDSSKYLPCSPNCASWPRASPPLPMPRGRPMPTRHPPAPTA